VIGFYICKKCSNYDLSNETRQSQKMIQV